MDKEKNYRQLSGDFLLQCAQMTSAINELTDQVDSLEAALAERERMIAERDEMLAERGRELDEITKKNAELMQQLMEHHIQVNNHFYSHVGNAVGAADEMNAYGTRAYE